MSGIQDTEWEAIFKIRFTTRDYPGIEHETAENQVHHIRQAIRRGNKDINVHPVTNTPSKGHPSITHISFKRVPQPDEKEWCKVPVWDGPYKMSCGRMLVNGECATHGKVSVSKVVWTLKEHQPDLARFEVDDTGHVRIYDKFGNLVYDTWEAVVARAENVRTEDGVVKADIVDSRRRKCSRCDTIAIAEDGLCSPRCRQDQADEDQAALEDDDLPEPIRMTASEILSKYPGINSSGLVNGGCPVCAAFDGNEGCDYMRGDCPGRIFYENRERLREEAERVDPAPELSINYNPPVEPKRNPFMPKTKRKRRKGAIKKRSKPNPFMTKQAYVPTCVCGHPRRRHGFSPHDRCGEKFCGCDSYEERSD